MKNLKEGIGPLFRPMATASLPPPEDLSPKDVIDERYRQFYGALYNFMYLTFVSQFLKTDIPHHCYEMSFHAGKHSFSFTVKVGTHYPEHPLDERILDFLGTYKEIARMRGASDEIYFISEKDEKGSRHTISSDNIPVFMTVMSPSSHSPALDFYVHAVSLYNYALGKKRDPAEGGCFLSH